MPTNGEWGPSVFAKYIDSPKKERPSITTAPRGIDDLASRWTREGDVRAFLVETLAGKPMLATAIEERGATRGFSKSLLRRTREQMGITVFKEKGVFGGPWFWALPHPSPEPIVATKPHSRDARRLRSISKAMGYRLQPIGKYPHPSGTAIKSAHRSR